MGKSVSKSENQGENLITVIQNQVSHGQDHEQQTAILWLILSIVLVQLMLTLHAAYKKRERRNAIKAARSVANINAV